jgi:hypothetical protein
MQVQHMKPTTAGTQQGSIRKVAAANHPAHWRLLTLHSKEAVASNSRCLCACPFFLPSVPTQHITTHIPHYMHPSHDACRPYFRQAGQGTYVVYNSKATNHKGMQATNRIILSDLMQGSHTWHTTVQPVHQLATGPVADTTPLNYTRG